MDNKIAITAIDTSTRYYCFLIFTVPFLFSDRLASDRLFKFPHSFALRLHHSRERREQGESYH